MENGHYRPGAMSGRYPGSPRSTHSRRVGRKDAGRHGRIDLYRLSLRPTSGSPTTAVQTPTQAGTLIAITGEPSLAANPQGGQQISGGSGLGGVEGSADISHTSFEQHWVLSRKLVANGAIMRSKDHGTRACYQHGCRCDDCRCAESEYQKERRQRINESVGEIALLSERADSSLTSGNTEPAPANSVVAAVTAEVGALGTHSRPGVAAVAVALAAVLDHPKATSCKPAAARVLISTLKRLRGFGSWSARQPTPSSGDDR
jgi:hypothetical protein